MALESISFMTCNTTRIAVISEGRVYTRELSDGGPPGFQQIYDGGVANTAVSVSLGPDRMALLLTDGTLLMHDPGRNGRTGSDDTTAEAMLSQVVSGNGAATPRFTAVACGARHTVALAEDGGVWGLGDNTSQQLLGPAFGTSIPVMTYLVTYNMGPIEAVACGDTFTTALGRDGQLWIRGDDPAGRGGGIAAEWKLLALPSLYSRTQRLVRLCCGPSHVAVLDAGGVLYVRGAAFESPGLDMPLTTNAHGWNTVTQHPVNAGRSSPGGLACGPRHVAWLYSPVGETEASGATGSTLWASVLSTDGAIRTSRLPGRAAPIAIGYTGTTVIVALRPQHQPLVHSAASQMPAQVVDVVRAPGLDGPTNDSVLAVIQQAGPGGVPQAGMRPYWYDPVDGYLAALATIEGSHAVSGAAHHPLTGAVSTYGAGPDGRTTIWRDDYVRPETHQADRTQPPLPVTLPAEATCVDVAVGADGSVYALLGGSESLPHVCRIPPGLNASNESSVELFAVSSDSAGAALRRAVFRPRGIELVNLSLNAGGLNFQDVHSIAVDRAGNMYLLGNRAVQRVTRDWRMDESWCVPLPGSINGRPSYDWPWRIRLNPSETRLYMICGNVLWTVSTPTHAMPTVGGEVSTGRASLSAGFSAASILVVGRGAAPPRTLELERGAVFMSLAVTRRGVWFLNGARPGMLERAAPEEPVADVLASYDADGTRTNIPTSLVDGPEATAGQAEASAAGSNSSQGTQLAAQGAADPHVPPPQRFGAFLPTIRHLELDVARLTLVDEMRTTLSRDGPVADALGAVDADVLAPRLIQQSNTAYQTWRTASTAANDAGSEPARRAVVDGLASARDDAADAAVSALQQAIAMASRILGAHTPEQGGPELQDDIRVQLQSFVAEDIRTRCDAVSAGMADPAVQLTSLAAAIAALQPGLAHQLVLDSLTQGQDSMRTLQTAAHAAVAQPAFQAGTAYIVDLATTALQPRESPDARQTRMDILAQSVSEGRAMLAEVQAEIAAAKECERVRAAWLGLKSAQKSTSLAVANIQHECVLMRIQEQEPTVEMAERLDRQLDAAAAARRAVDSARASVAALAVRGLAEAVVLLAEMQAGPAQAPRTEFDRQWAELESQGLGHDYRAEDYVDREALDRSYSVVWKARLRGGHETVVLKEFPRQRQDMRLFSNELRMLRRLQHPFVIALEAVLKDAERVYLQFPYVPGGNLVHWLLQQDRSAPERMRVFGCLVQALAYVHSRGVVHRDLKPANILISADGTPRLSDFGVSITSELQLGVCMGIGMTTLAVTSLGGAGAGTTAYKSPEQLRGQRASPSSDMYALGLVLHELVYGQPYGLSLDARAAAGMDGQGGAAADDGVPLPQQGVAGMPPALVEATASLLRRLLAPQAADRPSAAAVLADPLCDPLRLHALLGHQEQGHGSDQGAAVGGAGARAAGPPGNTAAAAVVDAVTRRLGTVMGRDPRRVALTVTVGPDLVPSVSALLSRTCAETGDFSSRPWRLDLSIEGAVDTERVLDIFLASSLRRDRRLFATCSPDDDEGGGGGGPIQGTVLPAPGDVDKDGAFAFGAALAQAALQSATALDAVARLPDLFLEVLHKGPTVVAQTRFTSLPSSLACLAQFDSDKARQFRAILQGRAANFGVELRGWQGVPESITDGNKADVLRRACQDVMIDSRYAGWTAVHAGFLAAGGRAVLAAMEAEGLQSLRPLVYDPGAGERRTRNRADDAEGARIAHALTKPCPSCSVRIFKDGGCNHMHCSRCGTRFDWA